MIDFDDVFYIKLLNYLKYQNGWFDWGNEFDFYGGDKNRYCWEVERKVSGKGFTTLKELVKDIFDNIRYFV